MSNTTAWGVTSAEAVPAIESRVLIALPRRPAGSEAVARLVEEACAIVAEHLPVRCRRAAELTTPEAVVEAVREASLLVADLGGIDPAVAFALGCGEALEREIVVLHATGAVSPPAARGWRRIAYAEDDPAPARVRLVHTLRAALEGGDYD
ncbi:MAG TPA: hypothetical protein VGL20_09665 [Candidatus Dormibacteraeota bacterium]